MTKAQFLALLSASGVAFVAGATVDFSAGPPAQATYCHALRIEAPVLSDGGLGADLITEYRTTATQLSDGGVDLFDIGPAACVGDTTPARTWVTNNCKGADGGTVAGIYVIEARPVGVDDGGSGDVAVEAYGDSATRCTLSKPAALKTFLSSLTCTSVLHRSNANPL